MFLVIVTNSLIYGFMEIVGKINARGSYGYQYPWPITMKPKSNTVVMAVQYDGESFE